MTPAELAFYNRQQQDVAPNVGRNYGTAPTSLPPGWTFQQASNEGPASGFVRDQSGQVWLDAGPLPEGATIDQLGFQPGPNGSLVNPQTGIVYYQAPDGRLFQNEESTQKWAADQRGFDPFSYGPALAMGLVGGVGAGLFDSALGIGGALPGELGGAAGAGAADASWGVNPIGGGGDFGATNFNALDPSTYYGGGGGLGDLAGGGIYGDNFTMMDPLTGGAQALPGGATAPYQAGYNPLDPSTYGGGGAGGGGGIPPGTSSLSKLFGGDASMDDYLRIGGALGATGLGYLGAEKQADAYRDVANQSLAIGAPHRARLEQSYQPGFDLYQQPGYASAFQQTADDAARSVSAGAGNPYGNPGAMAEIQQQVQNRAYLPALSNYRGQLGQFGGLGLNTSGAAQLAGAQSQGGTYDALGVGLSQLTNPQMTMDDWFKRMQQMQQGAGGTGQNYQIGPDYSIGGRR